MSEIVVELTDAEFWWGGAVADGTVMPWRRGSASVRQDLSLNAGSAAAPNARANQSAPLLVSSAGRYLASERPFELVVTGSELVVTGDGVVLGRAAEPTLRAGWRELCARFAPPSGRMPARELFAAPQYNTWIETPVTPTQEGVLAYARRVLDAGLPPGVLMIDDLWARDYGVWEWDTARFPDPAGMVAELGALGFPVMLWVVPFVSPDSAVCRELERAGLLLREASGEVAIRRWWNGWSAVLDLTDPGALEWFGARLGALQSETGVAGFKFDAGDLRDYRRGDRGRGGGEPTDQTAAYARFGAQFPFNEFRASWRAGGLPLAQRLHDKPPTWGGDGLGSLIPEGIAQGLTGHAFCCPDMVGGGDVGALRPDAVIDVEQFVRYAQCAALFPMMQFSLNPARVLAGEALGAVREAVELRQSLVPEILALAEHAAATGEPMLRPLAYHHPGLEAVTDQFLLGEDLLVAPVLEAGAVARRVVVPPGRWRAIGPDAGRWTRGVGQVVGEAGSAVVLEIPVGLASLPVWRREVV